MLLVLVLQLLLLPLLLLIMVVLRFCKGFLEHSCCFFVLCSIFFEQFLFRDFVDFKDDDDDFEGGFIS